MIFSEPLLAKVLDGSKTVTRRPVKYGYTQTKKVALPCKYRTDEDYAVQPGRGKKAVARIRIKDVRRRPLAGIDANDARLEGFRSVLAFQDYWARLYRSYDPAQLVDRIEFELVGGGDGR